MAIKCNICNKELDAFSGGRCKICRSLVCKNCMASGGTDQKNGIICITCYEKQKAEKDTPQKSSNDETTSNAAPGLDRKRVSLFIIGCFTLLCVFLYIIISPYLITQNALNVITYGPDEKLPEAKQDLANISGSYVIEQLKELALNGNRNTAIRAVYALGAQPNPEAVLILKELQLSDSCPEYLQSVIVEALLENSRLYDTIPAKSAVEE